MTLEVVVIIKVQIRPTEGAYRAAKRVAHGRDPSRAEVTRRDYTSEVYRISIID